MTDSQQDELGWHMTGTAGEVADILMQFAQELRAGNVTVWKGQRELHLDLEGRIEFTVEASAHDDGNEALHMHMQWTGRMPDRDALGGNATASGNEDLVL